MELGLEGFTEDSLGTTSATSEESHLSRSQSAAALHQRAERENTFFVHAVFRLASSKHLSFCAALAQDG
jgi:hypothetical protein